MKRSITLWVTALFMGMVFMPLCGMEKEFDEADLWGAPPEEAALSEEEVVPVAGFGRQGMLSRLDTAIDGHINVLQDKYEQQKLHATEELKKMKFAQEVKDRIEAAEGSTKGLLASDFEIEDARRAMALFNLANGTEQRIDRLYELKQIARRLFPSIEERDLSEIVQKFESDIGAYYEPKEFIHLESKYGLPKAQHESPLLSGLKYIRLPASKVVRPLAKGTVDQLMYYAVTLDEEKWKLRQAGKGAEAQAAELLSDAVQKLLKRPWRENWEK